MAEYSEWQRALDANKNFIQRTCPYCGKYFGYLMKRFCIDEEGHRGEAQYRYECSSCGYIGKTYFNETVARLSWDAKE